MPRRIKNLCEKFPFKLSIQWIRIWEKYEVAATLLAEMEKRAVIAETMLEATLQYGLAKQAKPYPRFTNQDASAIRTTGQELTQEIRARKIRMLYTPFGLDWGDKNKEIVFHKHTSRGSDGNTTSTWHGVLTKSQCYWIMATSLF